MDINEYKIENPEYENIPNAIVAKELHGKYYADEDLESFLTDVGVTEEDLQIEQAYKNKPELSTKRLLAIPGEGLKEGTRQLAHGIATQGKFKTEEEVKRSSQRYYEGTLSQTERLQYAELSELYTDEWTPSDQASFKALKEVVGTRGQSQEEMWSKVENNPQLESSPEFMQSTGQIEDIVKSTFASLPNMVLTGINPVIGGASTYYRMAGAGHLGMIGAGAEDDMQTYRYSVATAVITTPMEFASNLIQLKAMMGTSAWRNRATRFAEAWFGEFATEALQQPIEYTATVMAVNPDLNPQEILSILNSEKGEIAKQSLYNGWIGGWSGGLTTGAGMTAFDIIPSMVSPKQNKINVEKQTRVTEILQKEELNEDDKLDLIELAGIDPEKIEAAEIDQTVEDIKTRLLYQDADPLQAPGRDLIANTLTEQYGERQSGLYLSLLDSIARAGVDKGLYNKPEDFYTQELADVRKSKLKDVKEGKQQDKRGAVEYLFDETPTIMHLFESANASTPIHEVGHIIGEMMFKSGSRDYLVMAKHFGVSEEQTIVGMKAWDVKKQEAFAKSFEAYCMGGKAPTMKLQQIFKSMKDMLLRIYKSLANRYFSDVKMTDEVRGIFDQWVADDMARSIDPILEVNEWLGVKNLTGRPQTEFHTYEEIEAEAKKQVALTIQKAHKDKQAKVHAKLKEEAIKLVNNTPEISIKEQVNKKGVDPNSLKDFLSKEEIQTLKANNVRISKDGVDIYKEAYERGIEAETLLGILFNTQTRKQAEKAQYTSLKNIYADSIKYELAGAQERVLKKEIEILYKTVGKKAPKKNLKKTIRETTGQVKEEDYQKLVEQYKKSEIEARKNFKNKEKIIKLKELQLERIKNIRELHKQQKEKQRIHKRLGRLVRQKSIQYEYKQWINYFAGQFLKVPRTFMVKPPSGSVKAFITQVGVDTGIEVSEHLNLIEGIPDVVTGKMSFEDLQGLHNGIEAIANIELQVRRGEKEGDKKAFNTKRDNVVNSINSKFSQRDRLHPLEQQAKNTEFLSKLSKTSRGYFSSLIKPEFIMKQLDGWQDMGEVWTEIFQPIKKAEDKAMLMQEESAISIAKIFEGFDNNWRTEKFYIESYGNSITKEKMIMVALNSYNEGNRRCLVEGNGLTLEAITEIIEKLTGKEAKLVTDIWRLVDSYYGDRSAIHKEITGAPLDKVDGEYFPIYHDPYLSRAAHKYQTEDQLFNNTGLNRKNVKASARKGRIGSNYALTLQFSDIERSVAESIQDISYQIPVREAHRIIRDKDVSAAMINALGEEVYNELPKWVNHVANPRERMMGLGVLEKGANAIRKNTTVAMLGWKVSVSLKQVGSLGQTMDRVGIARTLSAMARFYTHPKEMKAFVDEMSPSIRNRGRNYEQNLKAQYNEVVSSQFKTRLKGVEDSFFSLIGFADSLAVYPSWVAAYEKGMEDFDNNNDKAIEYADTIVRNTQPTASAKDLPSVMTGNQLQRLVLMFYTYMSVSHNNLRELYSKRKGGQIGNFELAKGLYLRLIIPGLVGALVNEIGEDEWDTMRVMGNTLSLGVGGLPYVRDLYTGVFSKYGYSFSPVAEVGESVSRLSEQLLKEDKKAWNITKEAIKVTGYVVGLPSSQVVTTIDGVLNEDNPLYWAIHKKK